MITPQFLHSVQSGDEEAIETLVRNHQRAVFQIALSVLDDARTPGAAPPETLREAEAAARDTFVAAIDRIGRYREDMPFEPWLYGIAVQVSRRRARLWRIRRAAGVLWRRGAVDGSTVVADQPAEGRAPAANTPEADDRIWQAVRGLPENLRLAVVLRYYHEMSIADIARVLRVREGVVHARLDAARERVVKDLA